MGSASSWNFQSNFQSSKMSYLRQIGCFSNTFSTMDINCIICRSITYFSNIWPTFDTAQRVLIQSKNSFFFRTPPSYSVRGKSFWTEQNFEVEFGCKCTSYQPPNSMINIVSETKKSRIENYFQHSDIFIWLQYLSSWKSCLKRCSAEKRTLHLH